MLLNRTPDFYSYPAAPIEHAGRDGDDVVIRWPDGRVLRAYPLWLWENRVDGVAINPLTRECTIDPATLPEPSVLVGATVVDGDLVVEWTATEPTRFDSGWLRHIADERHRASAAIPPAQPWTTADLTEPPTVPGGPVADGQPAAMAEWLRLACRYGLARLDSLSTGEEILGSVVDRVGALRDTNFGHTWPVSVDPLPTSNANTPLPLPPHTDLPTRETPPGFQFLHCRENGSVGGLSTMADGYAVAAHFRRNEPDVYDALTTLRWTFFNRSPDHDHRWSGPIIDEGAPGQPLTLRAFHPVRGFPDMDAADVPRAYAALRRFGQVASSPEFQLAYPFRPGDLIVFDNRRILHGRTAIEPGGGRRVLHGAYADHDEIHSRLRVLTRQLESSASVRTNSDPRGAP